MSAARTERLLNLLTLLLNTRRPVSLREIREMEEFAAYRTDDPKSGERAFERDKAALVDLGVPLRWVPPESDEDEEGVGGYMVDREQYFMPELDLTPADLALLSIAGTAAAAIDGFPGRTTVVRTLAKLGFDTSAESTPRTLAYAPVYGGENSQRIAEHLEVLHDAVARRRRVRLRYAGLSGDTSAREVDPYGLYYRRGIWYLVAYCHVRRAERTFHLGRITELQLARQDTRTADFDVPDHFNLSEHAQRRPWEFPVHSPMEVHIRLAQRLVPAVAELFGRRAHVTPTDDGALVRLTVSHRAALIAAVLPFGSAAEVLAPADLRQEILETYELLAQRYSNHDARPRTKAARREASP